MALPAPPAGTGTVERGRTGFDTGSMAEPRATGSAGVTASPDTLGNMGSMQVPQSSQGNLRGRTGTGY
ncbi:MAG TPA: hypothetical protein VE650_20350 [Acetobacteraceae bacterium]|nr:hypothetical protein [Acetobacteraceae bacterium]